MGAKRSRLKIEGMPCKLGLMTSGHQQDIPEMALWRAKNVFQDLDGLMTKRPARTQWGQTIVQPDMGTEAEPRVTAMVDLISTTGALVAVDSSSGDITTTLAQSYLQFNVPASSGTESYLMYYPGSTSATDWSLRLMLQGKNLGDYTPAGTVANTLFLRARAAGSTGHQFALWAGGLYYKRASDNQYVLLDGTSLTGLGSWTTFEIRCDANGDTTVYLNETLVATVATSLLAVVSLTAGALFEIGAQVQGGGSAEQYNGRFAMPMYNDTITEPFTKKPIVAVTDFAYVTPAGTTNRVVLMAAGDYIYIDRMEKSFRPLHPKQRVKVYFTTYQQTLVWSDNDGGKQATLWQWTGMEPPEMLDGAPNFLFITEHQQRLVGYDPDQPLMILLSKARDPNVYIDPTNLGPDEDLFDIILDAAAIPVPAKRSDRITAIFGDYYGALIIWTSSSVWRLQGNGPFTYQLSNISQSTGCVNEHCRVMVGNDIWFSGFYGMHSLAAVQEFGDMQVQYPSLLIQSMWQASRRSPLKVNRELLDRARLTFCKTRSLVYCAFFIEDMVQVMVYNKATEQWHGPWDVESIAMESVEVVTPLTELVMHGDSDGRLSYSDYCNHLDFGTTPITTTWEWANLDGRSVDPALRGMVKTWTLLRVFYLPRGDFDYTARWYSSLDDPYTSSTENQLAHVRAQVSTIGENMLIGVDQYGRIYSAEEMLMQEIELDSRGYSLTFDITDNDDFALVGFQVEFDADGYEVDA